VTDQVSLQSTVVPALETSVSVGLDCETGGLNPRCDRVRLLTLATDRATYLIDCFVVDPRPLFEVLAKKTLIAHNALFDLSFLRRLGFVPGVVHDTILLSRLLYGTHKQKGFHALEACVRRELSHKLNKAEQKSDWSGELTQAQLKYAARDAEVLRPLFEKLDGKIKAVDLSGVAKIERDCLPARVWLADSGVAFDAQTWESLATEAMIEANELRAQLDAEAAACNGPLPPSGSRSWNSPKQVKAIFEAAGHPLERTDDATLAGVDHVMGRLVAATAPRKNS
jgi:DNA polymerase-1